MTDKTSKQGSSGLILDRRELMAGAAALGLGFGFGMGSMAGSALADDAPKKGGTLRLGMEGGSASDSLDPRTYADSIPISYGWQIWNGLTEVDSHGNIAGELAESWEAKPGATAWVFNIRKGVTFTSGKTLDADDVIYSLNLHRGETKSGAKDLLSGITDIKKLNANQIEITLKSGDADLPYAFADYHVLIVPNGFTDFSKPDGTGAYALESFEPGVRVLTKNKGNYWKPNRGNFDSIELRYIPDASARVQALISGQIDAANRLDARTVNLVMKAPRVNVVRTKGTGNRFAFVARCDQDPYTNNDLRLALKYGIDRKKIVDTVYKGFATIGNDTTIAPSAKYYAKDVPQRPYDPDKAAFHFKKAGLANAKLELQVSEGAFSGATDSAVLYQEAISKAGITLDVKRVSGDGYWDNVWLKAPFCAVYWGTRPTVDNQLSQTFLSTANWNDTAWKRPEFDKIIFEARAELDEAKRQQLYSEAQRMITDDGGMVCFAIGDYLDGYSKKVMGTAPHPHYDMCDQRIAEKGWFA
ncbi:ABC transporter substrate-binding protein [Labrys wisconsinensis]|uniref:Peptide/nickel transport system substrate-binding protein n=1 Tax=Labrys wisconsinensis TaxID=425677 RepID=A0ABU0J0G4_9HYPH|nr:ABC transporter substrate-binding protein [Labrys wisconsinensis]MDQ0467041.1 peptide/nickel transport system substrate-binding protein [Labrys wisconsinensis]